MHALQQSVGGDHDVPQLVDLVPTHAWMMPTQAVHDAAANAALSLSYLPLDSLLPAAELETGTRTCISRIAMHS
jgi:hypothetical protein